MKLDPLPPLSLTIELGLLAFAHEGPLKSVDPEALKAQLNQLIAQTKHIENYKKKRTAL